MELSARHTSPDSVGRPATRDVLAEADKLAGEGRLLDAIDLLVEANRQVRADEIEMRLVRLRNAAYAELDRSPTEPPWPDDSPRPRSGGEALPPIDRGRPDAGHRAGFDPALRLRVHPRPDRK